MSSVPQPQGRYVSATRYRDLIVTAGMTPRREGVLIQKDSLAAQDDIEHYGLALECAAGNALAAARNMLDDGEHIVALLQMTVYPTADQEFEAHARVSDFASALLVRELGLADAGVRTTIGVASLPGGAPAEIQIQAIAERFPRRKAELE